jgi:hypothetical protein
MALTITEPEGQETYPVYRFLETVGDGSGSAAGTGNYSVTPRVLLMTCRPTEVLVGHVLVVHIQDGGNFDPGKYGAIAALTNGVIIGVFGADGVEKLRLTQEPVPNNGDWAHYGITVVAEASAGDVMYVVRIDLAGGVEDGLTLDPGESIRVTLNDDFTGIDDHHFIFHGLRRKA